MPGLRPSNIFLLTEPMVQRWRQLATNERWRERLQGGMLCLSSDMTYLLPPGVRWRQLTLLGPEDQGQEGPLAHVIDLNALPLVSSGGGVYVRTEGRCDLRLQLPPGPPARNGMQAITERLQQLNFTEVRCQLATACPLRGSC